MCSSPKTGLTLRAPTPLSIGLSQSDKFFHSALNKAMKMSNDYNNKECRNSPLKNPNFSNR